MTAFKARVLIVDDDTSTLSTYERTLQLGGYDVATADDGAKGLHALLADPPDLALIDLRMPFVDGLEVLAEARQRASHVPIVILTAFDGTAAEWAARRLGAADFVHKPWDPDDLVTLVSRHLNVHASTRDTAPGDPPAYALRRWIDVVVATARGARDVTTQAEWGQTYAHGASKTTLQRWCKPFAVTPDDSLHFARALRIVMQYAGRQVNFWNVLDVADPKTMRRFLSKSGFTAGQTVPDLGLFLKTQRFISDPALLYAVERALERFSG